MTQYKTYVLMTSGGNDGEQVILGRYNNRSFKSLREARRISEAIEVLFPTVTTKIASLGVAVKPEPKVLKG
ncbi:MAG: hypothetical protein M0R06_00975 [Sphaerochaeta sp.]|jgi:hypothetical protein|nr:hypothetical protein [Sphaerochaeta sp.]